MTILSCRGVELLGNRKSILSDVTFDVRAGELVTILGPSGSGKSTLLRVIGDLVSPSRGEVTYKSKPIIDYEPTAYRKSVRYVPQSPNLFAGTVRDNLAFTYTIRKQAFIETDSRKILADFEMSDDYMGKDITKLSGGEKQRISLARSLLFAPEVLLLDEPTSALDRVSRQAVENTLLTLNKHGVTILWITHDEKQSERVASRKLHLSAGKITSYEPVKGKS